MSVMCHVSRVPPGHGVGVHVEAGAVRPRDQDPHCPVAVGRGRGLHHAALPSRQAAGAEHLARLCFTDLLDLISNSSSP